MSHVPGAACPPVFCILLIDKERWTDPQSLGQDSTCLRVVALPMDLLVLGGTSHGVLDTWERWC